MNLLLLTPDDVINNNCYRIEGRRFEHLKKTLKVIPGKILSAGMLNGQVGKVEVTSIHKSHIELDASFSIPPPAPQLCTLVLALPRPLMLKRILQSITSLGIKEIHFIHAEKVEKSFWSSSDLEPHVIQQQLLLGLEQAMDTMLPLVSFHKSFSTFINEYLSKISGEKKTYLAQPGSTRPCPANVLGPFVLAIGSEGGFTEEENNIFISNDFEPVQVGKRILRVETAVSVLLGKMLPL